MELPEATKVRLKTQHLIINELMDKLTDEQCNLELLQGKWTVHQQLAHLVRYQQVFYERIQIIISSFNIVISPYDADEDEKFPEVLKMSVTELRKELVTMRQTINDFYFNLNSGELVRKGRHTNLGNFSIALWAEFFLLHEAHHIFSIFTMTNQLVNREDTNAEMGF